MMCLLQQRLACALEDFRATTTQLVSFLLDWFRSFALFLGISDVLSSLSPRLLHLPLLCVVFAVVVRGSTLSVINTLV